MKSSNSAARLAAVSRSRPYMRPAKLRNSAPVRRPKSAMPSGTTPIWRLTSTGCASRSRPRISIFPELGASSPVNILIVVDFPAPLGPRKPKNCPGATRRSTPSTATSSPKRRVRPCVQMVGAGCIEGSNLAYRVEMWARLRSGRWGPGWITFAFSAIFLGVLDAEGDSEAAGKKLYREETDTLQTSQSQAVEPCHSCAFLHSHDNQNCDD